MRIRMKTIVAGPAFTAVPGQVIEASEDQGRGLCEGRYAEEIEEAVRIVELETSETDPDDDPENPEEPDKSEDPESPEDPEETEVETAEAPQGENAAVQTDRPKPRQRSSPKKK